MKRPWTLSDALHDCYDRIWSKQKSASGILLRMTKMTREFGVADLLIDSIDYDTLIRFTEILEGEGLKDATINRYLALISKALTEAVKRGKLTIKPPFPYRREPAAKLRWISDVEEKQLRVKAEELWPSLEAAYMQALIVTLIDTGGRLSEVLRSAKDPLLTAEWPHKAVTFCDTKNGTSRTVPLTPRAARALTMVPDWTRDTATSRFTRLRDACDLPDVSLHTLRHTCASRLVQGGMDLYRVKTWLGHSSISITERYAHLSPTHLLGGVEILSG